MYSDGASSGSGQTWSSLAFKRHRAVAPHPADYDLGSSEEPAAHMLLLDREQQVATVAPVSEAHAFLAGQWPEPEPMTPELDELFQQELSRLMEEHRNRPIDWDDINRLQREQCARMAAMLAFLDQQVPPSRDTWPPS